MKATRYCGAALLRALATVLVLVWQLGAAYATSPFNTLAPWQLPFPTTSTIGGVEAIGAVSHQWISAIGTNGAPTQSQPAFSDISGTASSSQLPLGTNSAPGAVQCDGTTITCSGGVATAVGGSAAIPGASGSAQNTVAACTSGSPNVTLFAALDFVNGQGISLENCGSAPTASAPSGLTVAANPSSGGTTSYSYQIACVDNNGGVGAAIAAVSISTGATTLGVVTPGPNEANAITYNTVSWTIGSGCAGTAVWRKKGSGAYVLVGVFINNPTFSSGGFYDVGTAAMNIPWVPATPNASALNDRLVTTISSGGGTANLVLAANAGKTVASAYTRHDDTAALNTYFGTAKNAVLPIGTFNVEGMTLPSTVLSLSGAGNYASIIQSWSVTTPSITAAPATAGFYTKAIAIEPVSYTSANGLDISNNLGCSIEGRFGGYEAVSLTGTSTCKVLPIIDNWYLAGVDDGGSGSSDDIEAKVGVAPFLGAQYGYGIVDQSAASTVGPQTFISGGTFWGIIISGAPRIKVLGPTVINSVREYVHVSSNTNYYKISNILGYSNQSIDYCISASDDTSGSGANVFGGDISGNYLQGCGLAAIGVVGFGATGSEVGLNTISGNTILNDNQDDESPPYDCDIQLNGSEVQHTFITGNVVQVSGTNMAGWNVCEANIDGLPNTTQVGTMFGQVGVNGKASLSGTGSTALTGGSTGL